MCVTSGRHEGGVTDRCNSQTLCWSASILPDNELYWHCLLNVTVSSSWTKYYKGLQDSLSGTAPPLVYLHVYLTSCTWLILPGRSPSIFDHSMRSQNEGRNSLGTRLFIHSACMLGSASETTCMHAFMHNKYMIVHCMTTASTCMHAWMQKFQQLNNCIIYSLRDGFNNWTHWTDWAYIVSHIH